MESGSLIYFVRGSKFTTNKNHAININSDSTAIIVVMEAITLFKITSTFFLKDLKTTDFVLASRKTNQIVNISVATINNRKTIEPVT